MDSNLPEPLTPADCDLRDYPWMPLNIPRLTRSKSWFFCKKTPELAFYMMNLWMTSWHEVPAASLEDDDDLLCDQAVCDPKRWPKVREIVRRNWVKCSDGRLYHATVAEEAKTSWEKKLAQRVRTEAARAAKADLATSRAASRMTGGSGSPVTETVTEPVATSVTETVANSVTETVTASTLPNLTLPNQESKKDTPSLRSGVAPTRKGGFRLPQDWQPSEADVDFAKELGLDPERVAPRFRDYWHSKAGKEANRADWPAMWRNWCRKDADEGANPLRDPVKSRADPEQSAESQALGNEWMRIMTRWKNDGCPGSIRVPRREDWVSGTVPDRELWQRYPARGQAVFRSNRLIDSTAFEVCADAAE